MACSRTDWVGNSRSKVANTCTKHCTASCLALFNAGQYWVLLNTFVLACVIRFCTQLPAIRRRGAGSDRLCAAQGLRCTNMVVGGEQRELMVLRKCTWLKCCYGKKPFGDPPLLPWCAD